MKRHLCLLNGPRQHSLFLSIIVLFFLAACQKEAGNNSLPVNQHNMVLKFQPIVQYDSVSMKFGTTYKNAFNEPYTVKAFKFYIHSLKLINSDSGRSFNLGDDKYYLINFADSLSTVLKLTVYPFKYDRISFVLGVDSANNVSGAQTNALDPTNGMFWTWNSGYIMAKLEGTSPVSTAPTNAFEYHIGGFKQSESVIKNINLLFPFGQYIDLKPQGSSEMTITADVNDWFNNPHDIRIKDNATCMTPGTLAQQIAENYSKMFTVDTVINNKK